MLTTRGKTTPVTGTETVGSRVYLLLRCGHRRLHNTRHPVPRKAFCVECPESQT